MSSTSRASDGTSPAAAAALASLRRRGEGVRDAELARAKRRLHGLEPAQLAAVTGLADRLVSRLLNAPARRLASVDGASYAAACEYLFALAEEEAA